MCAITLCLYVPKRVEYNFFHLLWIFSAKLHSIHWNSRKSKKETCICNVVLPHSSHSAFFSKALHARENKLGHSNLTFRSSINPHSCCHLGATTCVAILTNFSPACWRTCKTSGQFLEEVTWVTSKHEALCCGMGVEELAKLAWKQEIPSADFPSK